MKKIIGVVMVILGLGTIVLAILLIPKKFMDPRGVIRQEEGLPLSKYDFDALRGRTPTDGPITVLGPIKAVEDRRKALKIKEKYLFDTREISFVSDGKMISGMINYFPERSSLSPVIIMVRGYAEKQGYYPGSGTWKAADEFAKKGYATISLDFLGYADSDPESADALEARFHKVIELQDLIAAVKKLPWVDKTKIGIWAHSNGGQIVLSVLEIDGGKYPTALWAPMTNKFPDSVLTTIDEGSPVKEIMDEFLKHYDPRRYAFENYYRRIQSPVLIQQGTNDEWVRVDWQQEVVNELSAAGKSAQLVIYQGADHNMAGNNGKIWQDAVDKDIEYFAKMLTH